MSTTAPPKGKDPLVNFRAPADLVVALREAARDEGVPISELIRSALRDRLGLPVKEHGGEN
jgi:hypothetical protein